MGPIDPVNPYAPPVVEPDAPATLGQASLENALAGRYDFAIGDVMEEAWGLVKGMKASFWGVAVIIGLIYLVLSTVSDAILQTVLAKDTSLVVRLVCNQLGGVIIGLAVTPLTLGLQMMCVRRAFGAPISFATAFSDFSQSGVAMVAAFLVPLLTYVGLAMLLIPGIYLAVGYLLVIQLVGDQKLSAWKALETSRIAITSHWWSVFGLSLVVGLLTGLSALGLLIPLIWTVPWAMMSTAVLYRRIFYAGMPAPLAPALG